MQKESLIAQEQSQFAASNPRDIEALEARIKSMEEGDQ